MKNVYAFMTALTPTYTKITFIVVSANYAQDSTQREVYAFYDKNKLHAEIFLHIQVNVCIIQCWARYGKIHALAPISPKEILSFANDGNYRYSTNVQVTRMLWNFVLLWHHTACRPAILYLDSLTKKRNFISLFYSDKNSTENHKSLINLLQQTISIQIIVLDMIFIGKK